MEICKIKECGNTHFGLGYCQKHYSKYKKYGDPLHIRHEAHNMEATSEYSTWCSLKSRCHNKNHKAYPRYGGRGITICGRWQESFLAFYADMGPKPFPKAQIDRINNDGNYEPNNCRWVTRKENLRHISTTKLSMGKAEEIRKKYRVGNITQTELGIAYGVVHGTIGRIINNKLWIEGGSSGLSNV